MSDCRHAGMHWPTGGEHPDRATIYSLPGVAQGGLIMLADSARYWYDEARSRSPLVIWRGLPRPDRLPARLGWNAQKVADEVLNLWSEQPHDGTEYFVPLNELQFPLESGQHFPGFAYLAGKLGELRLELRRRLPSSVQLVWPAWCPDQPYMDAPFDAADQWRAEAAQWDVISAHVYAHDDGDPEHWGAANVARTHDIYRSLFPDHPIVYTEWNSNRLDGTDHEMLETMARICEEDSACLGYLYFIWQTQRAGEAQLSVWGNADRLALFRDPPLAAVVEPPPIPEPTPEPEPEMPDPWEHWSAADIARIAECPLPAVETNWPKIHAQMVLCEIADKDVQAAMIGTVAIESASTFAPVREAFWLGEDWRAANLRYYPYYGRGYIQLTWRENYARYGPLIAALWGTSPDQPDFDLVGTPDNALQPDISAAVSSLYFRDHGREDGDGIPEAARRHDWREVRRLVQGGDAGLDRLTQICSQLVGEDVPSTTERYYGVDVPDGVIHQQNSWTCAVRSAYAALWTMDQQDLAEPVTYGDGGPRDVYKWMVPEYDAPNVGLLDHTGAGLAQMLREHGYTADHAYPVTLAQVLERAGAQPVMIGGDTWNHWVYVRGRTNDGGLVLENPAPGHAGISDYLRDSFDQLGPMAMVWIEPVPAVEPGQPAAAPTYDDLANLEGVAYHEAGVVIPALLGAKAAGDWSQVEAVVSFLRTNDPHRAA